MPLPPAALEPLLRLALAPGIGPQRLAGLIRRHGTAERVLAAPLRELELLPGMGPAAARAVREAGGAAAREGARRALEALRRAEAGVVTPEEALYPEAFRRVPDAPYLLYAAGDLAALSAPGVAVVGTRAPSEYGREAAASLSAGLGRAGFCVVSGMARGIDAAAHRAALDVGAPTVGVLGHGIEQVYPAASRPLFERMRARGLLITEFPPGEKPRAGNFPRRNRLIAALSQGVLVVEMGLKSGAQHTVGYALEQGREVFAVPGPIGAETSAGTNQLIKDGARVVTSVEDVVEELRGVGAARPRPPLAPPEPAQRALPLLSPGEAEAMRALDASPRHVDELRGACTLAPGPLLAALLDLELKGLVQALPGKRYRRAGNAEG